MRLLLASASPRRAELLRQVGVSFDITPVDIDESPIAQENAEAYVCRMAREKAKQAWDKFGEPGAVVLAADTTVVVDNHILGKPSDYDDFKGMMNLLSGSEHSVLTALRVQSESSSKDILNTNSVQFCDLSDQDIHWYWGTGEPRDKAGGYGIQGLGARFVSKIRGSYSGIVGLPLFETAELLSNFGILPLQTE